VSYFAGGIVAHLLADESTRRLLSSIVARDLCDELVSAFICFDLYLSQVGLCHE